MKQNQEPDVISALRALGEILASQGEREAIVVVGGTALIVQGFVTRATRDVDVIAISRDLSGREKKTIEAGFSVSLMEFTDWSNSPVHPLKICLLPGCEKGRIR